METRRPRRVSPDDRGGGAAAPPVSGCEGFIVPVKYPG
jgi:hypothetical protein